MNELIEMLRDEVVQIRFTKSDGTERVLKGTLKEEFLPIREEKKSTIKRSGNTTCVWDVENKGFRSFRNDSVIDYVIIRGDTYV